MFFMFAGISSDKNNHVLGDFVKYDFSAILCSIIQKHIPKNVCAMEANKFSESINHALFREIQHKCSSSNEREILNVVLNVIDSDGSIFFAYGEKFRTNFRKDIIEYYQEVFSEKSFTVGKKAIKFSIFS